jgi:hypothetical protein
MGQYQNTIQSLQREVRSRSLFPNVIYIRNLSDIANGLKFHGNVTKHNYALNFLLRATKQKPSNGFITIHLSAIPSTFQSVPMKSTATPQRRPCTESCPQLQLMNSKEQCTRIRCCHILHYNIRRYSVLYTTQPSTLVAVLSQLSSLQRMKSKRLSSEPP